LAPDHWLLRGTFGRLMFEVGRWSDGLPPFRANVAADPFLPVSRSFLAYGLWNSGRLQEAESTIESAFARWPAHPMIWFQRFLFLTHTGRAAAAIALAENVGARPLGVPADAFAPGVALATAIATGSGVDVEAAVKLALERARRGPEELPSAIQTLAVLGQSDAAFDLLGSYFLERPSRNATSSAIGPLTRRGTDFLFAQPLKALRADARFAALTQAIGLDGYWRATGSTPDYRRDES
jgi:hypothetical protein